VEKIHLVAFFVGDDLIYETYQTSPDMPQGRSNHTLIFYYIDSDYITYVKFVIFDVSSLKMDQLVFAHISAIIYIHIALCG